jgi:hypothetical protein
VSQCYFTDLDDLPGPDGEEPYLLFINEKE